MNNIKVELTREKLYEEVWHKTSGLTCQGAPIRFSVMRPKYSGKYLVPSNSVLV